MIKLPVAVCAVLESAINGLLQLDDAGTHGLAPLHGKVVGLQISDFSIELLLLFGDDDTVTVMGQYDNKVDAWIKGSSVSLTRMGLLENPNDLVLSGDVVIEGDVDAAGAVRRFLNTINIDWEEHLSRLTGDIVAHQVGRTTRGLLKWLSDASVSLRTDMSEYLRYETGLVADVDEVAGFLQQVDQTRNDVERLQVRISRLQDKVNQRSKTS